MKRRIKQTVISTREQAESAMNELASIANNRRRIVANRDAEILAANEHYGSDIAICDTALQEKTGILKAWATTHPKEFPTGLKSISMPSGRLGFRTGTPKLALYSRAFTWAKVVGTLSMLAGWDCFIRTTEEVDKEGILGAHSIAPDETEFDQQLKRVGLKVIQDETFYVEPLLAHSESRQIAEAK